MIRIKLQYYAQLREQAGIGGEPLDTAAASLRELYAEVQQRHGFSLPASALKVAVNTQFSDWERPLQEGDVIVFIPPVAGG